MLRAPIGIISCLAMLVAQVPSGWAQNTISPSTQQATLSPAQDAISPAIPGAFKAYPKGGDELSKLIEDLIVGDRKLAPQLVRYVQTTPELTKEQRQAAVRGLAAALNRLKVQAADLAAPVYKAPPPAAAPVVEEFPWLALLAGAAIVGGGLCLAFCDDDDELIPVSP